MNSLSSLPVGVLVVGWLGLALLVAALGRLGVRALVPADEGDHVPQIASPLMPALGAVFAIFAALTLAGEAGYLRAAEGLVSDEAAASSRLAWAATSPGVDSEPIHSALRDYSEDHAHPRVGRGGRCSSGDDPATARAIATLEEVVRAEAARPELGSPASSELLGSLDAVTSSRRAPHRGSVSGHPRLSTSAHSW